MPGVGPSPATMRICEIDLDAMDGFRFILLLGLKDELLEDGVVASDNAEDKKG